MFAYVRKKHIQNASLAFSQSVSVQHSLSTTHKLKIQKHHKKKPNGVSLPQSNHTL